ncbi:MAG: ABC transporter substrate-binding protein [Campylobacterota bacterium]
MFRFINIFFLLLMVTPSFADETKVTLELKWLHQFQFAGFYMAKEKGFYRDAGLDVEILDGYMKDSCANVKSGAVDFGIGTSAIVIERSLGYGLVALGVVFQDSPIVWLSRADSNIYTPSDFVRKTVMRSSGKKSENELQLLLYRAGVDSEQINYVPTSFTLDDLINKKVDVYPAYKSNEPFLMKEKGVGYRIIEPADYGIHFYGDVLFTSEAMLHQHPETVKAFRDASFKGWKYAFEHLEESVDFVMQHYNPQGKTREHILFEAQELKKLSLYPFVEPGHMSRERWEQIIQLYNEMGMMHGNVDLDVFLYGIKTIDYDAWLLKIVFALGAVLLLIGVLYFLSKRYNNRLREEVKSRTQELEVLNAVLETKVAEKTALLQEEKENLSKAEQIAHMGSYCWNTGTDELVWSDEHYRHFGVDKSTFKPTIENFMKFVHPDDLAMVSNELQRLSKSDTPPKSFEFRIVRKDGSIMHIRSISSVTKRDAAGNALKIVGTGQDITKEHDAEKKLISTLDMLNDMMTKEQEKTRALQQMKSELEENNTALEKAKNTAEIATRAKSTFLANMSHEIRTPLNAINGFIALLKEEETDLKKLTFLNTIDSASNTLLSTINDVLDFSKLENGKLTIAKTDFLPYKEIMATAELFQAKAAEKNINLSITFDPNMPEVLFSDVLRIKQVINNLLSNAIKFTPENGEISLSSEYKDSRLRVFVRDSGIGIPQSKQDKIFQCFSQAEGYTAHEYGGTGLGLSISTQLINMLEGELKVASIVDTGSTFFFSIPVREGRLKERGRPQEDLSEPLEGKVLLVEDNKANQMFIGLVLQKTTLKYEIANDGIEAVEKFETGTYDLILMDENMPRLNGKGATQKIRKIEKAKMLKRIPIIALTANALIGDKELFINAGMDDYLSKPVEPKAIITVLHKFLKGSQKELKSNEHKKNL